MIAYDGVHLVATTLKELHAYANVIGLKRCWFEGLRKGHPHYDVPKYLQLTVDCDSRVQKADHKTILYISKNCK